MKEIENNYIAQVLEENNWNVTKASGILGINRVTLHKKIKRLGLKREGAGGCDKRVIRCLWETTP